MKSILTQVATAVALSVATLISVSYSKPALGANLTFDTGRPVPLILDDDGSQDGLIALAYMLQNPKFDVKAITISQGIARPQLFSNNLMRALTRLGITAIPVGVGSENPLAGDNRYPELFRVDSDRFYSPFVPPLTEIALETVDQRDAAQLIIDTIKQSPDPVAILATGSLTNIAEALRRDPSIVSNVAALEVMGGAVFTEGNLNFHTDPILAQNAVSEFNMWVDPVAVQEVFSSGLPVFLTPLDATNNTLFTAADRDAWRDAGKPESLLAAQLMDYSFAFISGGEQNPTQVWDLVAAINLSEPNFANEVLLPLRVDTTSNPSIAQGQTIVDNSLTPNVYVSLNPSFNNLLFKSSEIFSAQAVAVTEASTILGLLAVGGGFVALKSTKAICSTLKRNKDYV
ncbi:nucleoside hydrolase [Nostoc sp. CHAB 5824]|nr:nucleoside hydrolase [Nostoc sp. CHAB 5824]